MSSPELHPLVERMAKIDRRLERIDLDIDNALDDNDRERFQHLLRLRGVLLSERNQLGGVDEPPC